MSSLITLSSQGVITDPVRILDRLIYTACISHKSQSLLFGEAITSLPAMFQIYAGNTENMVGSVKRDLTNYIKRTFDEAAVIVSLEKLPNGFDKMSIDITAIYGGTEKISSRYALTSTGNRISDLLNATTERYLFQ